MSVVNTTYNFNQPNMNFGQALLYGAFGSLTGGMGCYGGFGGFGGYGMGGSLFSMMGMGMGGYGCGFGMYGFSDSMYGTQAGFAVSQMVLGGICRAIEGRGSAKAERKQAISDAKDSVNTLLSEIKSLENVNKGLKNPIDSNGNVTPEAKSECTTEANNYTSAVDELNAEKNKDINTYSNDTIKNLKDDLKGLETGLAQLKEKKNPPATQTEIEKQQKLIDAKKEDIKNEQTKAYNEAVAKKQEAVETAKASLQRAAQTKFNENLKKIEAKRAELKKAQDDLDEAGASDVKVSKKCADDEQYQKIVGTKDDPISCTSENVKDFVKAFNYKFSQFCKSSGSDKKSSAEEAIKVYDKINRCSSSYITSDMQRNMKIMKAYVDNGNQFEV